MQAAWYYFWMFATGAVALLLETSENFGVSRHFAFAANFHLTNEFIANEDRRLYWLKWDLVRNG